MKKEPHDKRSELYAEILKEEFSPEEQTQIMVVEREFSILPQGPERLKLRFHKAMAKKMGEIIERLKHTA